MKGTAIFNIEETHPKVYAEFQKHFPGEDHMDFGNIEWLYKGGAVDGLSKLYHIYCGCDYGDCGHYQQHLRYMFDLFEKYGDFEERCRCKKCKEVKEIYEFDREERKRIDNKYADDKMICKECNNNKGRA
jgi:hypothetical protein